VKERRLWFEGLDFVGHVACCDDVAFVFDGTLDHCDMVCVRDQGDDQIVLGNSCVESLRIGDIEGLGSCIFCVSDELLCFGECTARCCVRIVPNRVGIDGEIGEVENFRAKGTGEIPTVM